MLNDSLNPVRTPILVLIKSIKQLRRIRRSARKSSWPERTSHDAATVRISFPDNLRDLRMSGQTLDRHHWHRGLLEEPNFLCASGYTRLPTRLSEK